MPLRLKTTLWPFEGLTKSDEVFVVLKSNKYFGWSRHTFWILCEINFDHRLTHIQWVDITRTTHTFFTYVSVEHTLFELMVQIHLSNTRKQCVRRCHLKYFPQMGGGYLAWINFHFSVGLQYSARFSYLIKNKNQ